MERVKKNTSHNFAKNEKLKKELKDFNVIPLKESKSFPQSFLSSSSANWACETAKDFSIAFLVTADVDVDHVSSLSQSFKILAPLLPSGAKNKV